MAENEAVRLVLTYNMTKNRRKDTDHTLAHRNDLDYVISVRPADCWISNNEIRPTGKAGF
jgi:hypothetical protein